MAYLRWRLAINLTCLAPRKRRFQAFTGVINGALENLAKGEFSKAGKFQVSQSNT